MSVFGSYAWFAWWLLWSLGFGASAALEQRWLMVAIHGALICVWSYLIRQKSKNDPPCLSPRKRLRIVWAGLTQDWREETCPTCGDTWFAVTRATPSGLWCQTCEGKQFEVWRRDYVQRQQRKEIA